MVIMNFLRMLVDVAFYGAFAGMIAWGCGGGGAFAGMLIQSICFGLSRLGGSNRIVRLACLLPMALGWVICRRSAADCILMIPTAAYMIWLVWTNDYALSNERQKALFGVLWKALLVAFPIGLLLGGGRVLAAVTVPYAVIALSGSVLLMRALRHDPKVYCGARYQVINISTVAVVAGVAALLSSKTFLHACTTAAKAIYTTLCLPVLEFFLTLIVYAVGWIVDLLAWLFGAQSGNHGQEAPELNLGDMSTIFGEEVQMREPSELLQVLGYILLAAAAVVVLVLFFRWMNRRRSADAVRFATREERETTQRQPRNGKKKETSPVRKIRVLYREFLKWCSGAGVQAERADTSLDVHEQVRLRTTQGAASARIRALYIKARYADEADKDSVKEMKQLCDSLKKPNENGLR